MSPLSYIFYFRIYLKSRQKNRLLTYIILFWYEYRPDRLIALRRRWRHLSILNNRDASLFLFKRGMIYNYRASADITSSCHLLPGFRHWSVNVLPLVDDYFICRSTKFVARARLPASLSLGLAFAKPSWRGPCAAAGQKRRGCEGIHLFQYLRNFSIGSFLCLPVTRFSRYARFPHKTPRSLVILAKASHSLDYIIDIFWLLHR